MMRTRMRTWLFCAGVCAGGAGSRAALAADPPASPRAQVTPQGQPTQAVATPSEIAVLQALAANPVTAPYRIATTIRNGRVVLVGRVGTKQAHDVAVRTAIALGVRLDDDLVIDTAETLRAAYPAPVRVPSRLMVNGTPAYKSMAGRIAPGPTAGPSTPGAGGYAPVAAPGPMPTGAVAGLGQVTGTLPYPPPTYGPSSVGPAYPYPQMLFGRYDDPFWGFEPPVITYPPWWGAMTAHRLGEMAPATAAAMAPPIVSVPATAGVASQAPPGQDTPGLSPSGGPGAVEMSIDPNGIARLTGYVASEADKVAVAERLAKAPGVAQVINELTVRESDPSALAPAPPSATPPPPPVPDTAVQAPKENGIAVDGAESNRLTQALARKPALAGLAIRATLRDSVAYLTGRVPTAFEAMIAFRTAQQVPGVRAVDDRLEFAVPDGEHKNPLIARGQPEDVEPYLEAQVRRQVGDQAHIDRVRLRGDRLEIRGTVPDAGDRPRVEAVLRSMPLLRGFQLDASFQAE